MIKNKNGKQLSPCIISKVKSALNIKNRHRGNKTNCSKTKWDEVCEIIGKKSNLTDQAITVGKNKFNEYVK
jgi:hypothetical protein